MPAYRWWRGKLGSIPASCMAGGGSWASDADRLCAAADRAGGASAGGTIEIEFATGARMRITGAVDIAALTAAVAVLAGGRQR